MNQILKKNLKELSEAVNQLENFDKEIEQAASIIAEGFKNNNKLLLCGNGGSAAEAQHIAAEYVSSLRHEFKRKSLPAIALTTDTSFITATGNDYGFDTIFQRQIESLGNKGDTLIAISTSGNSLNVIKGIEAAKANGLRIIGFTGRSEGKMKNLCDIIFKVSADDTCRIQECHLFLEHTVCELVELKLFGEN